MYVNKRGWTGGNRFMVWNEAAIAKYVGNIKNKADNLWVKWVNHVYLQGVDWWNYSLHMIVAGIERKYVMSRTNLLLDSGAVVG